MRAPRIAPSPCGEIDYAVRVHTEAAQFQGNRGAWGPYLRAPPRTPRTMRRMHDTSPPPPLTSGILLTVLRALFVGGPGARLGIAGILGAVAASVEARGDDGIPFAILAVVLALVVGALCLYELALIGVCAGAWIGLRPFVWILLAASALGVGLPAPGLVKTPIAVVTLVGCVQWLERPRGDGGDRDPGTDAA